MVGVTVIFAVLGSSKAASLMTFNRAQFAIHNRLPITGSRVSVRGTERCWVRVVLQRLRGWATRRWAVGLALFLASPQPGYAMCSFVAGLG
jgi:hypothetical protein